MSEIEQAIRARIDAQTVAGRPARTIVMSVEPYEELRVSILDQVERISQRPVDSESTLFPNFFLYIWEYNTRPLEYFGLTIVPIDTTDRVLLVG